jgi:hypothetical protein
VITVCIPSSVRYNINFPGSVWYSVIQFYKQEVLWNCWGDPSCFSGWENVSWHLQSCIHLKGIWTLMLVEPCYMWFVIQECCTDWQLEDTYANPLWPKASFMCTMFQATNSGQLTTRNESFFPKEMIFWYAKQYASLICGIFTSFKLSYERRSCQESTYRIYTFFQNNISIEETQTLCTEEIEIKTDMELSSCSPEEDEQEDTRLISFAMSVFFCILM